MAKRAGGPPRGNQFRAGAKFDETTLIRLVYCFCQGTSTDVAARSTLLSVKTVRGVYVALRRRLTKPQLQRWHGTYTRILSMPSLDIEMLLRATFFDTLYGRYADETCARNYRLGNRKTRLCRKCPLPGRFSSKDDIEQALALIDMIYAFYASLGIRGETREDPVSLFRLRLIHTVVVATVRANSRPLPSGPFDPTERAFLSGGALLDLMLTDLADDPL